MSSPLPLLDSPLSAITADDDLGGHRDDNEEDFEVLDDYVQRTAAKTLCTLSPLELLRLPWVHRLALAHGVHIVRYDTLRVPADRIAQMYAQARCTLLYDDTPPMAWCIAIPPQRDAPVHFFLLAAMTEPQGMAIFQRAGIDPRRVTQPTSDELLPPSTAALFAGTRFASCNANTVVTYLLARMCMGNTFAEALAVARDMTPTMLTTALFGLSVMVTRQGMVHVDDDEAVNAINHDAWIYLTPMLFLQAMSQPEPEPQPDAKPQGDDEGGLDVELQLAQPAVAAEAGAGAGAGGHYDHLFLDAPAAVAAVAAVAGAAPVLFVPDSYADGLAMLFNAEAQRAFALSSADMTVRVQWLNTARQALAPLVASEWARAVAADAPAARNVYDLVDARGENVIRAVAVLGHGTYGTARAVLLQSPDASSPPVFAATKTLPLYKDQRAGRPCMTLSRSSREGYIGNLAVGREAVTAAMVTRLVLACTTPHFCMTYDMVPHTEPVENPAQLKRQERAQAQGHGMLLQVMELVETDLADVLHAWFMQLSQAGALHFQPEYVRMDALNTLVFQIVQALVAADAALDLRHNDLHAANVRVTRAAPAVWTYTVPDSGGAGAAYATWRVPNMGLCAKIIDFGMATSTKLFGEHDHELYAQAIVDPIAMFHANADATHMQMAAAAELRDVTHVLAYMLQYANTEVATAPMRRRLRAGLRKCVELTRNCGDPHTVGGLDQARFPPHGTSRERVRAAIRATQAQFGSRNHGLLRQFLTWWATSAGFELVDTPRVLLDDRADPLPCARNVWDTRHALTRARNVTKPPAAAAVFETQYLIFSDVGETVIAACPEPAVAAMELQRLQQIHAFAA